MSTSTSYPPSVLESIATLLGLGDCPRPRPRKGGAAQQWTVRTLVLVAVLMVWQPLVSLSERFQLARRALLLAQPQLGSLPGSYQGFLKAFLPLWWGLLERFSATLRQEIERRAKACGHWLREGLLAFTIDGTRCDCVRSKENREGFRRSGRHKSGPQMLLTTILHMGSGLVWACRIGSARSSERTHLRQMLPLLPPGCLLVADAGFVGYELLRRLLGSGRHFLMRVGTNVTLLQGLGYRWRRRGEIVYLWPQRAQSRKQPPLVLRLIRLEAGRHPVYLLTDLLSSKALSRKQAGVLYRMRWGIEVFFRCLKQTLQRRKMLSQTPPTTRWELGMTLLGLWLLQWLAVEAILTRGKDPLSVSVAMALRAVRWMLLGPGAPSTTAANTLLSRAVKDRYVRQGRKASWNYPRKKRPKPPGRPHLHKATATQVQKASVLHAISSE